MKQKMVTILVALIAQLLVFPTAQAFPDRPIKLVVPSTPGGVQDIIARQFATNLADRLRQPPSLVCGGAHRHGRQRPG